MADIKGRLIQVAQSYTNGQQIRNLESGEFGFRLDEGQEQLWIGSHSGNIEVVTERNISRLAIPDHSVGRLELDGEINTLLDKIGDVEDLNVATSSEKGLMSGSDKAKLDDIEDGANKTEIVNNLTSLSATSALSAYQGKILKDLIDEIVDGGSAVQVVNDLFSTSTTDALSANQGRILKSLVDGKANNSTATQTSNGLMSSSDKAKLDNLGSPITITNTLTSTSTTSALSAYQGKVLKDLVDDIVNTGSVQIVDNLTSSANTSALSANQGRILKGLVDGKANNTVATQSANGLMSRADKAKLDGLSNPPAVVNNLTSTSTTSALSANQGRILKELIDNSGGGGSISNVYQYGVSSSSSGTAFGYETKALGQYSTATGYRSQADGNYSFVSGITSDADGYGSAAFGVSTLTESTGSFSAGSYNTARGYNSTALGYGTLSTNFASTAIGHRSNMGQTSASGYNGTVDAFVVGNGTSGSALSNAFRVRFNGMVYGIGAYNTSGADYAEYFEWLDGNVDNEDRVGHFVALDGDKIRIANSSDDYILGVVSANPSVIGDASSEGWNDRYIRDEFGRTQYHYVDVEYEELDEDGNIIIVTKNEYHPIYNPNYDPTLQYTPREERHEWDAIGMMGKLLVRDDGTCEVNGYCKSNDDGIATKSDSGYRVMKRVSDNIVQVLLK